MSVEEKLGQEAESVEDSGTSEKRESVEQDAATEAGTSEDTEEASDESEGTTEVNEKWLVPGRFKTAEDVLNSYQHLESAYGRTQNELQNLRKAATPQRDQAAEVEEFARAAEKNPVEAIRRLARQEAQATEERFQAREFENTYRAYKKNAEFAELEPTMVQISNQFGDMIQENGMQIDPRLLDILFLAARGLKANQLAAEAESKGKRRGEEAARKKAKAQVEGASGSKGQVKRKFEDLSLDEMRKELERGNV